MTRERVVKQGDHISKIAHEEGFRDWKTLWDANPDLKAKRQDPNVLFKGNNLRFGGDVIKIPERKVGQDAGGTNAEHAFEVARPKLKLQIRILRDDFTPVKKAEYEILPDTLVAPLKGKTDDDGVIAVEIPDHTLGASLSVRVPAKDPKPAGGPSGGTEAAPEPVRGDVPITWDLQIGALNPVKERAPDDRCISGVQQRLNNLNINSGPVDGILGPNTKAAIQTFQEIYQIKTMKGAEGEPDGLTQDKLHAVHDGVGPVPTPPSPGKDA